MTDTSKFTKLEVVNQEATYTVTTKFGGGTKTEGRCFFCSIGGGSHCENGMKVTAIADNGRKCSIDYLATNMPEGFVIANKSLEYVWLSTWRSMRSTPRRRCSTRRVTCVISCVFYKIMLTSQPSFHSTIPYHLLFTQTFCSSFW